MNLRSALRRIAYELGLKGGYTHDDVIAELRTSYPDLIAEESRKLETIALKRILSDVDARQVKTFCAEQSELFPELAGFPGSYDARAAGLTDTKGVRVLLQRLPIKIVRAIATYSKPPKKNSSLQTRLKDYLGELSPYIQSDDEMFSDVIKRSRG